MPLFIYRAMAKDGRIVRNRVEETDRHTLVRKIKDNRLIPISVNELRARNKNNRKKKNIKNINSMVKNINTGDILSKRNNKNLSYIERLKYTLSRTEKVTTRDLVIFTQNFYLLKKANFNNIHALNTIIEGTENQNLRDALEDVLAGVEAGENMYTTMEYYPEIFPYIYINMIKVGELSGSLTNSLQQAVTYLDDTEAMTKRIKKILVPNLAMFIGLLVMLLLGTILVIPLIQNIFDQFGTQEKLPAITIWFSGVVDVLIEYWYIPLFVVLGIALAIIIYVRTPKGRYNFHYFKYTMPIFGKLIYAIDFARFSRAVLLNIENGVRIQDALEVSKNVVNNYVMLSIIETSINNILVGQSWIEPFEKTGLSTPMITEMLKIGMQTDLTEMMRKLLEYMDIDINNIMEKIMKALPEVIYALVGAVLIFFVVVVLVPMIQIYMGSFLFSAAGV